MTTNQHKKPKDRYWALGMGEWIEIRVRPTPPRAHRSSLKLKGKRFPLDIPIFNYTGGEVLVTIDRNHLYRACKMFVEKGEMKEIKVGIKKVLETGR